MKVVDLCFSPSSFVTCDKLTHAFWKTIDVLTQSTLLYRRSNLYRVRRASSRWGTQLCQKTWQRKSSKASVYPTLLHSCCSNMLSRPLWQSPICRLQIPSRKIFLIFNPRPNRNPSRPTRLYIPNHLLLYSPSGHCSGARSALQKGQHYPKSLSEVRCIK